MSVPRAPRILHVMQPSVAGVPMAVIELVAHQRASGIDARIAAPDENNLPARCEDRGIPFVAWTASRNVGRSLFAEMRSLRRINTDFDPAIVHLHSSKAGLAGRLVLRRTRTTVFSPHGWSFFVPSRTQSLALRWERFAARWTSQFHVCCDDEARVGAENGIVGDYFSGLNGVDAAQFEFSDESARNSARRDLQIGDEPTVVCIGRICHQKGQDLLLEAWQQRAAIFGSGDAALEAVVGTLTAAVVGYAAIRWLLRLLTSHTLWPFIAYRLGLAGVLVWMLGASAARSIPSLFAFL